ncbi:MAG: hypothetical protein KAG61_11025 [Bacteriovoracaceae bacterium]|nr:hypothetical protein [Bacteriovoracaceae bacterium]
MVETTVVETVVDAVIAPKKLTKGDILAVVKEAGIELAEETAVATVRQAFDIIEVLAPKISLGLGAMVPAMRRIIEPPILALLDKIDGQDNPDY